MLKDTLSKNVEPAAKRTAVSYATAEHRVSESARLSADEVTEIRNRIVEGMRALGFDLCI